MREIDEGNGWKIKELLDPSKNKRVCCEFVNQAATGV